MQVIVREPLALQQEAKSVDGVFEITLGRCVVLLLKQIKIILYLVGFRNFVNLCVSVVSKIDLFKRNKHTPKLC